MDDHLEGTASVRRSGGVGAYGSNGTPSAAAGVPGAGGGSARVAMGWLAARWELLLPLVGLVVVQRVLFPAPLGVVVNGALVGGRIALIALGIALIYRANRIMNFSQGDLGTVPASLAVMLVAVWGWSYWLGLVAGLAAALVLGALVELLIIRRFFRAPRLVVTVATIGVAQVLTAAGLFLPRAFGEEGLATRLAPPVDWNFELGGTIFNANDVLTMMIVPAALVALALFLQRSTIGIAILGAAERADRASTLGIPVRRLHTVVWMAASLLAFLAMFLRAGAVGLPVGRVLAPTFLVQALAAAVFGRFIRLPTIAAAAVGLGILDQAMVFHGVRPGVNDAVLFVVVLVGLLVVRRSRNGRRVDHEASTWQATAEVRAIPRQLARLPEVRAARALGWVALVGFVVSLPAWLSTSKLFLATGIVLFGIVAASLVVLTGWAGQVSLGHMAFVGLGAAIGGALTDRWGWDLTLAGLTAGLAGAGAAAVVGYPALRRGGLTLAVSTLAFAVLVSSYGLNRTIFDWLPGQRIGSPTVLGGIPLDNETRIFYVALIALTGALVMVVGLRRSRTGRVLIAIRENQRAARAYGINVTATTLTAFAISGFLAAVAGALFVHQQGGLSAPPFLPQRSLDLFTMVVIGGLGSLPGALLGATYVQSAHFFLPSAWQFLASGAGLLLVLLIFPAGLGAALTQLRDTALRWVARRRNLVVPSLLADLRVEDDTDVGTEDTLDLRAPASRGTDQSDAGTADSDSSVRRAHGQPAAEAPA